MIILAKIGNYTIGIDQWDEISHGNYACSEITLKKDNLRIEDREFIEKLNYLYENIEDQEEFIKRVEEEINWYEYKG